MKNTFYFYDLETSGLSPSAQRIMQFGGIRTDENLEIIGDPFECYVKLTEEVIPDPEAILVTGISPQKANEEGYSEPEFIEVIKKEVFKPNTIIVGYNNIRFDDEFLRNLMWRNLQDPYEWHWKEGRSRWDFLDVVRTMRALRPDGMMWPIDKKGGPTNRLEELTKENKIEHSMAHTALADVVATIEVAKLVRNSQPDLFKYLLSNRDKKSVSKIVDLKDPKPFLHTSGKLPKQNLASSVFYPLFQDSNNPQSIVCFDLRHDPSELSQLSVDEIKERMFTPWKELEEKKLKPIPIKGIHINKSPSVVPLGVANDITQERINLSIKQVKTNLSKLHSSKELIENLKTVFKEPRKLPAYEDSDQRMYDGFISDSDKNKLRTTLNKLEFNTRFSDDRINDLVFKYKAKNHPSLLDDGESDEWQKYIRNRFKNGIPGSPSLEEFNKRLAKASAIHKDKDFLVTEMKLYLESIMPI